jgi:phage terminase large subunit
MQLQSQQPARAQRVMFKPYPKQEEFLSLVFSGQFMYIFYGGAAGGGKTYVTIATLILLCKLYPGSKWVVVRKDAEKLRLTSIPSFFKVCPPAFLKRYNRNEKLATFTNGSQIQFMGENIDKYPDLTNFDGVECNGFLLEECQELSEKMHHKANLRAGRNIIPDKADGTPSNQPRKMVMYTGNPSQNWTKKTFYTPYILGELPPGFAYVHATMDDNPALSAEYIASLDTLDPITYARYRMGDWDVVDTEMPFAYAFDMKKHVGVAGTPSLQLPMYLSFDFNVDPITCIASQHNAARTRIRVYKEFRKGPSNIYELCRNIRNQYPEHYLQVTGDATGSSTSALVKGGLNYYKVIRSELKLATRQFRVPTVNPTHKDSRVLCNSLLYRHPDYIIDGDGCPYLIEDMQYVEVNAQGEINKTKNKHQSHLLDCWRYYNNAWHGDFVRYRI